ncbi:C45 family autoproteolytic acyltransferase/hydrolase [Chelatococcus sp. SYSU_G07232]|uniref:C45 family autoproteolytic acyltransferase/hydrolase n=1 Tax=Chelatococcus albus TaxID=3047466 RepID=A0ABT7AIB4_9HYPH|nr:C45 family peptidase [Chelatococcus sp. SYSU_G07232]MDJ1159125.1 C45 family autoproteolytic acyltransferase/hydrolase [Chelatococcus sp. SYSU_G07232]
MTLPIPLIDVTGGPAERGYAYGKAAAERVARGVELYRRGMHSRGVAWTDALAAAGPCFGEIAATEPLLAEEMRGIAEGAGVPLEGVVIINARSEILHRMGRKVADVAEPGPGRAAQRAGAEDGCTGVVVLPEASADRRVIHAQNWDWMIEARETVVLLRLREGEHELLTFVEAGGLARCGLNSAGIAVTGNSLQSDVPLPERGLPMSLIRRKILAAASFAEALRAVYHSPRGCANNVLLSHAAGEAIDLETTPREVFWLPPADGLLTHANHFRSPGALARLFDKGVALYPDSLSREARLARLLRDRHGTLRATDVMSALLDRWGAPDSVLTLPQEEWPGIITGTTATIVMVPARGELFFCLEPEQNPVFHRAALTRHVPASPGATEPVIAE